MKPHSSSRRDCLVRVLFTLLLGLFAPVFQGEEVTLTVPASSDPWLAGMPPGSSASANATEPASQVPGQSPVELWGLPLTPGQALQFKVSGQVNHVTDGPFFPPAGDLDSELCSHSNGPENGISDISAPICSLLGVFLGSDQPSRSPSPSALAFSEGYRDRTTRTPALKQVFYIGNGLDGASGPVSVVIPSGATRMFFGVMDAYGFQNNNGSFVVTIFERIPLTIVRQPQNQRVIEGSAATFSVAVDGDAPVRFQWLYENRIITNATSALFTMNHAHASNAGYYRVRVSNPYGSVTSSNALLTVVVPNHAPVISPLPDLAVAAGQQVRVQVSASDVDQPPQTLAYSLVEGGPTGATIDPQTGLFAWTPTDAQAPSTNQVIVRVVDNGTPSLGDQSTFLVMVRRPLSSPKIVTPPQSLVVRVGSSASFTVEASGSEPLSYQWRKDGVNLGEATNTTYRISLALTNDAGAYTVLVSNEVGQVESIAAQLTVKVPERPMAVLEGQVSDAVRGTVLTGVEIVIGGVSTQTDDTGWYSVSNLLGGPLQAAFDASVRSGKAPLTVQFFNLSTESTLNLTGAKEGYLGYSNRRVPIRAGETTRLDFSMSPTNLAGLRIVLNWGARPRDLDAHLLVPPIDGKSYEIAYLARGRINDAPYAQLDQDRTSGFGPETITLARLMPGTYGFYVHNYQDDQGNTGELAGSAATVQIYGEKGLERTIQAPSEGTGNYWDVCAIDGVTGTVTIRNVLTITRPAREGSAPTVNPAAPGLTNSLAAAYLWDFGDGTTSTNENPVKVYAVPGTFDVRLRVVKANGNEDVAVQRAFVTVGPLGPRLTIHRIGEEVILRWTLDPEGWVLESTDDLLRPAWRRVADPAPVRSGSDSEIQLPLAQTRFFRLTKP